MLKYELCTVLEITAQRLLFIVELQNQSLPTIIILDDATSLRLY